MLTRLLKNFALLLLLALGSVKVCANDLVVERAWVEDPHGHMTIEQVQLAPQQRLNGLHFGQGFSSSVFWIRVRIDPNRSPESIATEKVVVRIRPVYLDEIQMYDPLRGMDHPATTGDRYSWLDDEYKSLNLNFLIPLGSDPRDVWFRLKTSSSTLSTIEVIPRHDAELDDWQQTMIAIFLVALLFTFLGWGLLAWLLFKDRLIKLYIAREMVAVAYATGMLGGLRVIGANWLSPVAIDAITNFLFCFYGLTLVWFESYLLAEFSPPSVLLQFLKWNRMVFVIAIGLLLFNQARFGVQLNSIATVLAIALTCITAVLTKGWNNPDPETRPVVPKYLLIGLYVILGGLVVLNRLAVSGVVSGSGGVFYLLLIYPIASGILVMVILQIRAHKLQNRQAQVNLRLQFAEKTVIEERKRRIEQGRFLSMLSHELKSPVSVAKINLDAMKVSGKETDRILKALQNINDVVDRCHISDAIENQKLSVRSEDVELRDLLFERIDQLSASGRVKVSEGNEIWVRADSHLVGIVVSNLLDNALKYSPVNSLVTVTVAQELDKQRQGVCLRVTNDVGAAGIPDQAQIFEKYYRAKGAECQSGSGLGLYLSSGLVSMLGGTLQHRVAGDKVEFIFWLPI